MRILIVRFRALGDVVLTTPAVAAIKKAYPEAAVEFVADDLLAPILEGNPALSRVHAYPRSRFRRISTARRAVEDVEFTFRVARRGYDLVLDLHGNPRAAWLTFLTGAPRRVGFAHVRLRSAAYTTKVVLGAEAMRQSTYHHLALARAAGARAAGEAAPRIYLSDGERAAARERLGPLAGRPFLAIHPGASNARKRWPPERFVELARLAAERFGLPTLVLNDPASPGTSRSIAEGAGATFVRDSGVRELAALTGEAALFCGNDSGPMHVAAAVGVPVLAVFGPNSVDHWRPLVTPSRVVTPPEGGAARDVPLNAAARALEELVEELEEAGPG